MRLLVTWFAKPIDMQDNTYKGRSFPNDPKTLQWKPSTSEEMLKFLGIIIEMGLVQMTEIEYYWSKSKLFGSEVIQNTMSRDRFELLLKFFRSSNNQEGHADQDRLFKLRPLLDLFRARFKSIYVPGSVISIDEAMVPWKGRLITHIFLLY